MGLGRSNWEHGSVLMAAIYVFMLLFYAFKVGFSIISGSVYITLC